MPYSRAIVFAVIIWAVGLASAQSSIETVEGELWILEDAPGGRQYALRTAQGTVALKLDAAQVTLADHWGHLRSGMRVRVRGVRQGQVLLMPSPYVLDQGQRHDVLEEHLLPNTTGDQSVLLILAQYANSGMAYTPTWAHDRMANEVQTALQEFSFGQLSLTVTTTAWLPIPLTNAACDFLQLADLADTAAATAGFPPSSYQRIIYGFSFTSACLWHGLGSVGGTPSRAWLNGIFAVKVAVHELGHNLGLLHSHSLMCGDVTLTWPCPINDLGDWLDTMGSTPSDPVTGSFAYPHFNAVQKDHLGWFAGGVHGTITEVTSSGVYRIGAYADAMCGPKALKIRHPTIELETYYYLEARRAVGTDAFLDRYPDIAGGVLLHITDVNDPRTSFLLDTHPDTQTWDDAALQGGEFYRDPWSTLEVFVVGSDTDGAEVAVNRTGDELGLHGRLNQTVYHAGDLFRLEFSASIGTQPAQYGILAWGLAFPGGGWVQLPTETLGADGTATFEVTVPPGEPVGVYAVHVSVTWWGRTTSGQLSFLLQ